MNHLTLIKIHGYIAVFFLPMALLYAVTGALYIVGKGGAAETVSFEVAATGSWPATTDAASALADRKLRENGLPSIINAITVTSRAVSDTEYYWRTLSQSVTLTRTGEETAELWVQDNSLYRQLVEIHKNHAGILFAIIGFGFGIAMAVLILSGALMMFRSRLYRRSAMLLASSGTALCLVAYGVSVLA